MGYDPGGPLKAASITLIVIFAVSAFVVGLLLCAVVFGAQPPKKIHVTGRVDVIQIDADNDRHDLKYFLHHDGKQHELKFKKRPNIRTDAEVQIDGTESLNGLTIDVDIIELMQVLPNTLGGQKTVGLLINFANNATQPYTVATAKSVFATVSNFYRSNSFNQTWLADAASQPDQVDVYGWFTIASSSNDCASGYNTIAAQADAAAQAAGVDLNQYRHKVYGFPSASCGGWWGLGTIGGNPSRAWINGSFELAVVSHEMGHNFGLFHSHSICAPGCSVVEYGDIYDTMGAARNGGDFNAYQKERLGWLNYGSSPPILTVLASGQYRIGAYEAQVNEPKAVKIFKGANASGQRLNYYVEYRVGGSYSHNLQQGVVVHVGNENDNSDINLWDIDQVTSVTDWIMNVGQSFVDQAAGVSFTVSGLDADGANLAVQIGTLPLLAAPSGLAVQ